MIVYVVEYGVHYESYIGDIFFKKEDAEKQLSQLKKECEEDDRCTWNGGSISEKEVQ